MLLLKKGTFLGKGKILPVLLKFVLELVIPFLISCIFFRVCCPFLLFPPEWNKELLVVFGSVICPVSQYLISWHLLLSSAVHSVGNVVSQQPHHIVARCWNSFRYTWEGELLKEFSVAFSHWKHCVSADHLFNIWQPQRGGVGYPCA